ncbi:TonB-dependent siderophore receptor [Thalassotalea piscium]
MPINLSFNIKYSVFSLPLLFIAPAQSNTIEEQNENIEKIEVKSQWQPYRGNVPLSKTPQAVVSINANDLEYSGITRFQEALDFSSSVVRQNTSGGMWDSFAIRGFAGDENNAAGYLVNGFNVGRGYNGRRSTSNIEIIEVMKGPGSALYGQGEPGGTINIITKKPKFDEEGYVQASVGNFNTRQAEFDYTNALNNEVAFRLNGAYEDSDSYRDIVNLKALNIHPSLLWNISDQTSLNYEMEIIDQDKVFDRGIFVLNNDFDATDSADYYGDVKDGPHTVKALGHQVSLKHSINNNWHLLAGLSYRDSSFKGQSSDAELSSGRQLLFNDPNSLSRQRRERDYQAEDLTTRLELSGETSFFDFKNNLLLGIDYYDFHVDTKLNRWRTAWGSGDPTYSINPNNPNYDQVQPQTSIQTNQKEDQKAAGLYFQDQIELTNETRLLVGVRFDKFKQDIYDYTRTRAQEQDKSSVSPRIGFIHQLNDIVSVYTNYAEGFRPNPGLDSNGNAFEPEESQSFEVGVKWQNTEGDFLGSFAVYDSEKSNILTADPVNNDFSATLGEATSQGVELEMTYLVTNSTRIDLSYSYTDAKTANETTNSDWGVSIPKGSRLINIAEHMGYISLKHDTRLLNKETFLGATLTYTGDRLGETIDPNYILPSYTLVNLFASMQLNEQLTIKIDINNLLDKAYFASSYHKLWTIG